MLEKTSMLRRLIVMRHAKSSWESDARSDHERPLNARGQRDAPRVGEALAKLEWTPDLVLSSDSLRTRETLAGMQEGFGAEVPATFLSSFYHAGPDAVREEVPKVDDSVACLLVLGHNPGWEHLVTSLTGEHIVMKTGTAALMTQELPAWASACEGAGSWKLERVIYPREL